MAVTEYGNTLIICLSTDAKPAKADGWFLKETDTGNQYYRGGGVWISLGNGFASTGTIFSNPPTGCKKVVNIYYDPELARYVMEREV